MADKSNASPERQRQRLFAKYEINEVGCWVWTGAAIVAGYGRMRIGGGKHDYVHRISYRLHKGPIPDGLQIDHLCRNRRCFNPAHLEAVTCRVNTLRGEHPNHRAHRNGVCRKGLHPLTGHNVMRTSACQSVRCRACNLEWQRQRRALLRQP